MQKVIGVDEVGRGAWAGPLVVGAVLLGQKIHGLKDSKKLTKSQREDLAKIINSTAEFVGLGWVSASEVDDLGLTKATTLACQRALKKAPKGIKILIDGNFNYLSGDKIHQQVECVVNGDAGVAEISAASIVAKVARDEYMSNQGKLYPNYGFEKNVGYGTSQHLASIREKGLTPLHRWSFKPIKDIMDTYEA